MRYISFLDFLQCCSSQSEASFPESLTSIELPFQQHFLLILALECGVALDYVHAEDLDPNSGLSNKWLSESYFCQVVFSEWSSSDDRPLFQITSSFKAKSDDWGCSSSHAFIPPRTSYFFFGCYTGWIRVTIYMYIGGRITLEKSERSSSQKNVSIKRLKRMGILFWEWQRIKLYFSSDPVGLAVGVNWESVTSH